jgi:hypothetical protein
METLSNINDTLIAPFGLLPVVLGMSLAALVIALEWWKRPPHVPLTGKAFFSILSIASVSMAVMFAFLLSKTANWGGSDGYFTRALNIVEHGVFGEGQMRNALFPPGYTFLLVPMVEAIGASRWAFFIANIALLLLATLSFRYFLLRLHLPQNLANLLALLLFLYPNRLLSTLLPFSDVPFSLVWGGAFAFLVLSTVEERPLPFIAAAGVLAGAAALVRSNGLPLLLPLAAGILLSPSPWKARVQRIGVFAGVAILVIAPWLARNYSLFGKIIPVANNGGINLSIGNNPSNPLTWNRYIDSVWQSPVAWAQVGGTHWNEAQRDSFFGALALEYIAGHPQVFLASGLRRVGRTFGADTYNFGMLETYTNARVVSFQVLTHADAAPSMSRIAHSLYRTFYVLLLIFNNALYYALMTLSLYLLMFHRALARPIRWSFILTALIVCAMIFMTMGLSRYKEPLNAVMLVFLAVNMSLTAPRTAREP